MAVKRRLASKTTARVPGGAFGSDTEVIESAYSQG